MKGTSNLTVVLRHLAVQIYKTSITLYNTNVSYADFSQHKECSEWT